MLSFSETPSSTSSAPSGRRCGDTSGMTCCAAKLLRGSSSTTRSSSTMAGVVVKMSAASASPLVRASTVSGPPASLIGWKDAGSQP